MLRGKRRQRGSFRGARKRPRTVSNKRFVRTIVCIPFERAQYVAPSQFGSSLVMTIPRGNHRTELHALNLCAKLDMPVECSEEYIRKEISELFSSSFVAIDGCPSLSFDFLSTIPGLKLLQKAKVNCNFRWDGNAVQSLSRSVVYITTHEKHLLKFDKQQKCAVRSMNFVFST